VSGVAWDLGSGLGVVAGMEQTDEHEKDVGGQRAGWVAGCGGWAGRAMRAWAQELVERARTEGVDLTGDQGLLTSIVKEVLQAGLDVEMTEHLGYEPYAQDGRNTGNSRNGAYPKRVTTDVGPVELQMPRDREGTLRP
jgi:hypothetical protein